LSRETAQTFVAWCPKHGIPLNEAEYADGWNWCPECEKVYRVIIKDGKVMVIEDNERTYEQSPILRWHMGILYAAKMQMANRKKKYITVNAKK